MFIPQTDFFWQTSMLFVNKVMKAALQEHYEQGAVVFHKGDPATHFFILMRGRVRLVVGGAGHVVYTVNRIGEAFGWSSLMVPRSRYTATGICGEACDLVCIDGQRFLGIVAEDPENGLRFYQGLALTLGHRLVQLYDLIEDMSRKADFCSCGSGQFDRPVPAGEDDQTVV